MQGPTPSFFQKIPFKITFIFFLLFGGKEKWVSAKSKPFVARTQSLVSRGGCFLTRAAFFFYKTKKTILSFMTYLTTVKKLLKIALINNLYKVLFRLK